MRRWVFIGVMLLLSGWTRGQVTLVLTLDHPVHDYSLTPAPLRYNKDFAFSFAVDDGLVSAALVGLPYLGGGTVSPSYMDPWGYDQGGDGRTYPGLFYTDGCGHTIPFRAAAAINGKSIGEKGRLNWDQVKALYRAGWDVYDHGYAHLTGEQVNAAAEIRQNGEVIRERTGIAVTQFVEPGGKGDSLSEEPYAKAAFAQGRMAVHCGHFPIDCRLPNDSLTAAHMRVGRWFISSSSRGWQVDAFLHRLSRMVDSGGGRIWINAFTHSVGNDDVWGISLKYPDFRDLFDGLAARYGAQGRDNIWVASFQAVQEYQVLRYALKYAVSVKGNKVYCRIDTRGVPAGLRHRAMSFVWQSTSGIRSVECRGCVVESYGRGLVNVQLSPRSNWK